MQELLIIIAIVVFLVLILTFLLSVIVKKTNVLIKNVFVEKMSEFDYLIGDKERKIVELNDDINNKKNILTELEEKSREYEKVESKKNDDIVIPKFTDFEDGNLFYNYKVIKEKFNYDAENVLRDFFQKNRLEDNQKYQIYKKVREYFSSDVIYKLSLYSGEEQYDIITELLNDEEKKILGKNLSKNKFDLRKLIDVINEEIIKNNPEIKIYVGNKNCNYDKLNSNVKTIYDEKITEGFKIVYKGVVYDYSI